ncbi:hypothetical protein M3Y98_00821900 [Aphelenchoides besseyi]|nr:hypothetical protein M3Y98_00821900 [Aphelenchoides besseyi]KAI6195334.1 hypothetical protein M3Y96_01220100 [Aphelenchoides besseyi]
MMQSNIFPIARDQRSSTGSNRNSSETARQTMSNEPTSNPPLLCQSANISRSDENALSVYESYSWNRPAIRGRRSQRASQQGSHRDLSSLYKRGHLTTLSPSSNYVAYEPQHNQTLPVNFSSKHNDRVLEQLTTSQRRPLTIQKPPPHQKQMPLKPTPPTDQNNGEQANETSVQVSKAVVSSTSQEEEQTLDSNGPIERHVSTPQPTHGQESATGRLFFQLLQLAIEDEQPSVFKSRFMGYVHANYSALSELPDWQNFAVENPRLLMQILSSKPSNITQST